MTEKVLLNSGYKYFKNEHPRDCDRYYQKKIAGFDDEPTKFFSVYYYDLFGKEGELDYNFEYEYVEDRKDYWYKTYLWGLDKNYPYTIEEIEKLLLKKSNNDWILDLLKGMIKEKSCLINLGRMQIKKEKSSLTQFNFSISINKSVFEDVLSDEEKGMIWLEKADL